MIFIAYAPKGGQFNISLRGRIESAKLASDVIKGEWVRVPHVLTISSHRSRFLFVVSWTVRHASLLSPERDCGRL